MTVAAGSLEQFYDERYADGYMDEWPEGKKRRVAALVSAMGLPARGRALDFGCGQGVFTRVLQDALPGWEVCGTELSRVALDLAARRLPRCRFLSASEIASAAPFDFVFTHHVLEHVSAVDDTLHLLASVAAPRARMLHILPCGNDGSLEHWLAGWRSDGVDRERGNRFFFEDAGHLRRMTSADLVASAASCGWRVEDARFANHFWGAVDWMTALDFGFIRTLTDTARAADAGARRRLLVLRAALACVYAARRIPGSPMSRVLARGVEAEWRRRQHDTAGSEMYVVFGKSD